MASAAPQPKLPFPANYGANSSHLLERRKLNAARRATPDSDALASSDDEGDHLTQSMSMHSTFSAPTKPTRRSSWLSDVQNTHPRKFSFGAASLPPNISQPATPSSEQGSWSGAPTVTRAATTNSFPWSSQIWTSDSRKEPPSRLTEVLQSPTARMPFGNEEESDRLYRDQRVEPTFPFQIPLEPNRKAYRSQSYSVGQTDNDAASTGSSNSGYPRVRPSGLSSVKGRRSRPSMLGDYGMDSAGLGQVREDDDDDESSGGSNQGVSRSSPPYQPRVSHDGPPNHLLRQAAPNNGPPHRSLTSPVTRGHSSRLSNTDPRTPTSDSAIDEVDQFEQTPQVNSNGVQNTSKFFRSLIQSSTLDP